MKALKNLITIAVLLFAPLAGFAGGHNTLDSIGTKDINGKTYIIHKVEPGQGLYGISKKYNISQDEILEANPDLKDNGLKAGAEILIPLKVVSKKVNAAPKAEQKKIEHIVKTGETLFRIASIYGVKVDEIREWNKLGKDEGIAVGQKLIIYSSVESVGKDPATEPVKKPEPKDDKPAKKEEEKEEKTPEPSVKYIPNSGEIIEKGFCKVAESGLDQNRNFALHKTAAVGTIIMVTNPENNKSIFVRITGKLEDDNKDLVIIISDASAKSLGLANKGPVNIVLSYGK